MLPLFGPVPGGAEMLVVLLVAVLVFGLPLALLGGLFVTYRSAKSGEPASGELAALRTEVERLREEVDQLEDDGQPRDEE